MYNPASNILPGQGNVPQVMYQQPQRYGQPQYYQPNYSRHAVPTYMPQQSLQHSHSFSSNAESNHSPPSAAVTPVGEQKLRQPTPTLFYNQQQQQPQYIQQMQQPQYMYQMQQNVNMMQQQPPRMPGQQMQRFRPPIQQYPPAQPRFQATNQNFPSVGYFQVPTQDNANNYNDNGNSRNKGKKGKDRKNPSRNDQQDSRNSERSSPESMRFQYEQMNQQQQPQPPPQAQIMVQNPMFYHPQMQLPSMHTGLANVAPQIPMEQLIFDQNTNQCYMQTATGFVPLQIYPVNVCPQQMQFQQQQQNHDNYNLKAISEAIETISQEARQAGSREKSPANEVLSQPEANESVVDANDLEDYTPPGTPQEITPVDDQQIADYAAKITEETDSRARSGSKSFRKPEQQHYQPPRAQARRTESWRSNASGNHPSETVPAAIPAASETPNANASQKGNDSGSNTPTPTATPMSTDAKSEAPSVPMIGGIPLFKVEEKETKKSDEFCTYCHMIGKPEKTITNHSLYSNRGVPACPTFRDLVCKLCSATGDNAHLPQFCRKFQTRKTKEHLEFEKLGAFLFGMSTETRRSIVLKDFKNHPTRVTIRATEESAAREEENFMKLAIHNTHTAEKRRQTFDEDAWLKEHQQQIKQDQHNYRGGNGGGGNRTGGGGYSKGGMTSFGGSDKHNRPRSERGGSRGSSRGGRFDQQRKSNR